MERKKQRGAGSPVNVAGHQKTSEPHLSPCCCYQQDPRGSVAWSPASQAKKNAPADQPAPLLLKHSRGLGHPWALSFAHDPCQGSASGFGSPGKADS
jgi:hypothetical protein